MTLPALFPFVRRLALLAAAAGAMPCSQAQVSFTGAPYVQDFNALPTTANNTVDVAFADNVTLPGWYLSKPTYSVTDGTLGGSAAAFDPTGTVAQNVGHFSFGTSGSAERALGMRATAALAGNSPLHMGVRLVNNTGTTITRVSIAYTGEQWFKSSNVNGTFTVTASYQLGATSLTSGTWLSANAAFVAPITAGTTPMALDGNAAGGATTASYAWPGLEVGKEYEWYAAVSDGVRTVSTPPRRFTMRADAAPTVALTAPAANTSYVTGASVSLTATSSDPDGTVARVEFFDGGTKIGEDTTAPYQISWPTVATGSFQLTAVTRDNAGNATMSAPVSVTVTTPGSGALLRGPYLNQASDMGIVVRWRSGQSVIGRVRYGTSPSTLTQSIDESASTSEHVVTLTGLSLYTRYYYSVGSAVDVLAGGDAEHTFRTSPTPGSTAATRIWVLGDCGRANASQASVRDAYYTWTGARTPDLCLMLGDNAYNSGTDAEYQASVFAMYPAFLRKMPLWSCLGNHDANNGSTSSTANFPYFDMFTFPTAGECGGVASGSERYFSFDYGNIHFINLDSQTSSRSPTGAMASWLQNDLATTTRPWIIAFFHHPPYSKGSHNSDTESQLVQMRQIFGPMLEAGGVDLVLTGHSHSYERTFFIDGHYGLSGTFDESMKKQLGSGRPAAGGAYRKPLTGPRDHFGAVYTLTGSAGSADGGTLDHPAMYVSYNTLGSFNIDVNGNQLDATYIEANGQVTDTFSIVKQGAADSDGDRIPDEYEILHGLNRHLAADALLDADADGVINRDEWLFGMQASVADAYAWAGAQNAPNFTITLPSLPGRIYRVWFSDDLLEWLPASPVLPGNGAPLVWTDDGSATGGVPGSATQRFYRVRVSEAAP